MIVRLRAVFKGRVQGVFFRANAKKFAEEHGVEGWVRNTESGDVEALFVGEEQAVREVIGECQHSQPYARVDSVEIRPDASTNKVTGFRIMH